MHSTDDLLKVERTIALLAAGSWVAQGAGTFDAILRYEVAPYSYLIAILAVVGVTGGLMYFAAAKRWRFMVGTASGVFLLLYCLRFFWFSLSWQLDQHSLAEALPRAFGITSMLIQHTLSIGQYGDGIAITFYEWLMPAFQVIVLLGVSSPFLHRYFGSKRNGDL